MAIGESSVGPSKQNSEFVYPAALTMTDEVSTVSPDEHGGQSAPPPTAAMNATQASFEWLKSSQAQPDITAQAHTQLGLILFKDHSLVAVMERVAQLAKTLIPEADEVSVTLIQRGRARTVAFSVDSRAAAVLDERQYADGFGPCIDAAATAQIVCIPDTSQSDTYPSFGVLAQSHGIRRTLAVGMPTLQETSGALNIYSYTTTGLYDADSLGAASTFAGYAALTLFNSALYADALDEVTQMQQALASRAGIEQAKGILMRDRRCSPDEAFDILVKLSNDTNRKLRDVAEVIVNSAISNPT